MDKQELINLLSEAYWTIKQLDEFDEYSNVTNEISRVIDELEWA